MYVVKFKFKEDSGARYSTNGFHEYVKDIRADNKTYGYLMTHKRAKELYWDLLTRESWNEDTLHWIAIVRVNEYPPYHSELEVVEFKEFK